MNWITCGNALRLDWLSICPPTGSDVKMHADDLFHTPLDQAQIDFENEGGETYICGNPPYIWANNQTSEQKQNILSLQSHFGTKFRGLDYVSGWFYKYALYSKASHWYSAMISARRAISAGKSRSSIPRKLVSGISVRWSGSPRRRLISASITRISL